MQRGNSVFAKMKLMGGWMRYFTSVKILSKCGELIVELYEVGFKGLFHSSQQVILMQKPSLQDKNAIFAILNKVWLIALKCLFENHFACVASLMCYVGIFEIYVYPKLTFSITTLSAFIRQSGLNTVLPTWQIRRKFLKLILPESSSSNRLKCL